MMLGEQARDIVSKLTLEEKAGLCSGKNFWELKELERLGLKSHMITDGPHGLRKQAGAADHLGINKSIPSTSFPTVVTTACSFDPQLLYEMGEALGEKCIRENVAVILGPGINMKRSPLCGRNFEYFSEDSYLTAEVASGLVDGIQSKGIGTSLKHFAANNQEAARMVCDTVVDERALRETYLSAFESVVKKTQPWTVMCSYNRLNGIYASEHKWLLSDVLRDEWGFEGLVVSDWGATAGAVQGIKAGLDLEMPYSGAVNAKRICKAVEQGTLTMEELDKCVLRNVKMYIKAQQEKKASLRTEEDDHKLARKVAAQSMVLLKNKGILPLKKDDNVAFIGEMAKKPRYQGSGSSKINPSFLDNAYSEAIKEGYKVTYADGYLLDGKDDDGQKLREAVELARASEKVVIFVGLPDEYESEGFDRDSLKMPIEHLKLIDEITNVNKDIVVVLQCGSPVELPWKDDVSAVLLAYLGGQGGGMATVDLLWGKENPSGKLAETWPVSLETCSSYNYFPGNLKSVEYRESIYIGYRYYDAAGVVTNYPFGYGMSYTTFDYSNLNVEQTGEVDFTVSVDVENTGECFGREIAQLYIAKPESVIFRAPKELKGFAKVALKPGEKQTVTMKLNRDSFRYYNVKANDFCVEGGSYNICVGKSSQDLLLEASVEVKGDNKEELLKKDMEFLTEYFTLKAPLTISDEQFTRLLGHKPPYFDPKAKVVYNSSSSLGDIKDTLIGKVLMKKLKGKSDLLEDNADAGMKKMAEAMIMSMPLRAISMSGAINLDQIDGLADMANRHYIRGIRKMLKK